MAQIRQQQPRTKEEQQMCDKTYAEIKKYGIRRKGMAFYEKFLAGGRLTLWETLMASCWRCNGYGEQEACASPDCPNYPYYMEAVSENE